MADVTASSLDFISWYGGYIFGFATLAAILFLNLLIYRHRWKSYPTLEEYLAAHPECDRVPDVLCSRCGTKAAGAGVVGRGCIYRCTWCETELYRVDHQ